MPLNSSGAIALGLALLLGSGLTLVSTGRAQAMQYPPARTVQQEDDYNGVKVQDPYRWLENITGDEVHSWVEAENKVTRGYLDAIPGHDRIAARLKEVADYERFSAPSQTAGRYFWSKNDGLQNQYVEYWSEGLNGTPKVLLDPNSWSADGTVALAGQDISEDGKWLLYAKSSAGSDWVDWFVMNIDTGQQLSDHIEWSKGGGSWNKDASGFFYERYPAPKEGEKYTVAALNQMYYFHKLGTPQSEDQLVYSTPEHPDWWIGVGPNERRDLLLVSTGEPGSDNNDYGYIDLGQPGYAVKKLIPNRDGQYSYVYDAGGRFWFWTNKDAPLGKLIEIDAASPEPAHWKTVIPEGHFNLESVNTVGGFLWANYLKDACTQIVKYSLDGQKLGEVPLPGRHGSAGGFGGRMKDSETFYSYTDLATPNTIYRYNIASGASTLLHAPTLKVDVSKYETEQLFYRSFDGTAVPIFLVYKKGLQRDGSNPTILYAYGGFQASQTPYFSSLRAVWLDMGGVYAIACIRGGSEYGEGWHASAIKQHRQTAFSDFIGAAQFLIDQGYTSTPRLAVNGASNGGMLIGAVETQRPDLFGVCLPDVGVMDMLRFNQWGFGKYWESDYGSPQNPDEFAAIYAYSPYHNIKAGTRYPATLITTADTDDRVMPAHSFKYAARMQAAQPADGPPIILRVQTSAGHGAGKPFYKVLDETADEYAFCFQNMGLSVPELK